MKFQVLVFYFSLFGFIACAPPEEEAMPQSRPNIIFLLADDLRDNMFSIDGHPDLKTPNFDRLIQNGVRFSNTYIAEPVCSPSRVSLFTGVHERVHGVGFSSSYQLTEDQWRQTYPALLRENGYYTGFVGKIGIEYYTFKGAADQKFDFWYGHDGWTRFFPKDYDTPSTRPYHDANNDIITPVMSEGIRQFLDSVPADRPFHLSVSFNVPHGSQTTSMYPGYEGWHSMIRPANQNPKLQGRPPYDTLFRSAGLKIPEATTSDPYQYIPQSILDQDGGRNKTYDYSYTRETCLEHHIRYYQTITGLDLAIGDLMQALNEKGLEDNTIIIFASDHGLLMGEYGMGGKALLYDLSSKIPCFIYHPGLPDSLKGRDLDQLVSSLDIPATILDYSEVPIPEVMEGKSLKPLMEAVEVSWRDELFLESLFTLRDNPFCEGIRVGNWKYIRMFDGVNHYLEADLDFKNREPAFEQLFNLEADPDEVFNLAEVYANTEMLQTFREKVKSYSAHLNQKRIDYKTQYQVAER